jgi:hypothetical protein
VSFAASADDLYRRAVLTPGEIDDHGLAAWLEEAALSGRVDRSAARALRKAARNAARLARYWTERDASSLPDWRNGVDEVLGASGWRPQLDLATARLEAEPSPEAFEEVKRRFRAVHFTEWMEGVSFEEWVER